MNLLISLMCMEQSWINRELLLKLSFECINRHNRIYNFFCYSVGDDIKQAQFIPLTLHRNDNLVMPSWHCRDSIEGTTISTNRRNRSGVLTPATGIRTSSDS